MNKYTSNRYIDDTAALQVSIAEANAKLAEVQKAGDERALTEAEIAYATSDAYSQAAEFGAVIERNKVYASQETRKSTVTFGGVILVAIVGSLILWKYIKRKNLL